MDHRSFPFVLLISVILAPGILFAEVQEPKSPDSPPPASPPPAPETPSDAGKPETPKARTLPNQLPGVGHDPMVDRRLAAFVRLRELMFEHVSLDAEKRKKIDRMFDDYMAGLLNPTYKPHMQPRPEDFATPQQLPALQKELQAAQSQNDLDKVEVLKARIYAAKIVLEPHVVDEPNFFFNYLYAELNDEQKKQVEPVINRWRLLRVAEVSPDNDYKQLRRAARDPLLNRTPEQEKEIDALIIEGYRTIPFEQRNDQAIMTRLASEYKPKVAEKLDQRQREHLDKTLAMLEEWEKVDPEVARKTRERLKDHKPERTAEHVESQPKEPPAPALPPQLRRD